MQTIVLTILKKYWKAILILILLAALAFMVKKYIDGVYDDGMRAGIAKENAVWVAERDRIIEERAQAIARLEAKAKSLADALDKSAKDADIKVAELNKKLAEKAKVINTTIYTKDGKTAQCTLTEDIYLGSVFSESWNQYNNGILQ